MKHKKSCLAIIAMMLIVVCIVVIIVGVCVHKKLDVRIRALENKRTRASSSDLQSAIDFFKDQTQVLIWMLGVILTIVGAVLAFFEITTRKSIEEKYEQRYEKLLAAKDSEIFKKQIVLIYQENDDSLVSFRDEIFGRVYNTKLIKVSTPDIADITSKLDGASIVVYQVISGSDPHYHAIADLCESKSVHCILYCPAVRLADDFMNRKLSYVSTSIQLAKLRESFYTLLYLAP